MVSYGKGFQGVEQRARIFLHSGGVGKGWGGVKGMVGMGWAGMNGWDFGMGWNGWDGLDGTGWMGWD